MIIHSPDTYPIEFEEEEINTIKDAIAVLNGIIKTMNENNCDTLEGGCIESPTGFFFDEFCSH